MKKHINLLLTIVAVAVVVVATVAVNRLLASARASEAALAGVLENNASMKVRIDALQPARPRQMGVVASAKTEALGEANKKRLARMAEERDALLKKYKEFVKNDREFALKYYADKRSDVDLLYGPFYRVNHLAKEQSESLAEALFQRRLRRDEIQTAQQLKEPGVDVRAMRRTADTEFATAAKEALGDDLYGQFLLYERQRNAWNFVTTYGGESSLVDMTLSVEQAAQLADAIANACPAFRAGKQVDMKTVDWNAVDAVAVDFLTPGQLDFLRNANIYGQGSLTSWPARQEQELSSALENLGK
jgi:hypothetical protein